MSPCERERLAFRLEREWSDELRVDIDASSTLVNWDEKYFVNGGGWGAVISDPLSSSQNILSPLLVDIL